MEVGGNQDKIISMGQSARYKTRVRDMIETREEERPGGK